MLSSYGACDYYMGSSLTAPISTAIQKAAEITLQIQRQGQPMQMKTPEAPVSVIRTPDQIITIDKTNPVQPIVTTKPRSTFPWIPVALGVGGVFVLKKLLGKKK